MMDLLRAMLQEQVAVCLVGFGFLSLAAVFALRRFAGANVSRSTMRQAFWTCQALLLVGGLAVLAVPTFGYTTMLLTTAGCVLLVLNLKRLAQQQLR